MKTQQRQRTPKEEVTRNPKLVVRCRQGYPPHVLWAIVEVLADETSDGWKRAKLADTVYPEPSIQGSRGEVCELCWRTVYPEPLSRERYSCGYISCAAKQVLPWAGGKGIVVKHLNGMCLRDCYPDLTLWGWRWHFIALVGMIIVLCWWERGKWCVKMIICTACWGSMRVPMLVVEYVKQKCWWSWDVAWVCNLELRVVAELQNMHVGGHWLVGFEMCRN